jgi:hypothetical protein
MYSAFPMPNASVTLPGTSASGSVRTLEFGRLVDDNKIEDVAFDLQVLPAYAHAGATDQVSASRQKLFKIPATVASTETPFAAERFQPQRPSAREEALIELAGKRTCERRPAWS